MEMRSTVKEREVFTSSSLASKILFTLQVRLKDPMPWEAQVRVMEEPSTTGSGDSGVMNGTGKAGGGGGEGEEPIENMLYQSILSGRHRHGNTTYMLPLARLTPMLQ